MLFDSRLQRCQPLSFLQGLWIQTHNLTCLKLSNYKIHHILHGTTITHKNYYASVLNLYMSNNVGNALIIINQVS